MENIFKTEIVKTANKELQQVSENLIVKCVSDSGAKIYRIYTSVKIKGNKDKIAALENLAWEKTRRFKVLTEEGYEMHQGMSKYFRKLN